MASRVTTTMRPVHTVEIGGKRRKFHTAGAAWYALAKSAIGTKYMGALAVAGYGKGGLRLTTEQLAGETGLSVDVIKMRADMAVELFVACSFRSDGEPDCEYFDSEKWTSYVRRVAKKWRALDEHREKTRRG